MCINIYYFISYELISFFCSRVSLQYNPKSSRDKSLCDRVLLYLTLAKPAPRTSVTLPTSSFSAYIRIYIYIYTYIGIYICNLQTTYYRRHLACIYIYICTCIHIYTYICTFVHIYVNCEFCTHYITLNRCELYCRVLQGVAVRSSCNVLQFVTF